MGEKKKNKEAGKSSFHILLMCKNITVTQQDDPQRQTMSQKPFPANNFIETNNIFAVRGKKNPISLRVCNKQRTPCQHKFLTGIQNQITL